MKESNEENRLNGESHRSQGVKIGRRSLVTDESIRRYIADQATEGLS